VEESLSQGPTVGGLGLGVERSGVSVPLVAATNRSELARPAATNPADGKISASGDTLKPGLYEQAEQSPVA
jgi:hypothetical protein